MRQIIYVYALPVSEGEEDTPGASVPATAAAPLMLSPERRGRLEEAAPSEVVDSLWSFSEGPEFSHVVWTQAKGCHTPSAAAPRGLLPLALTTCRLSGWKEKNASVCVAVPRRGARVRAAGWGRGWRRAGKRESLRTTVRFGNSE